MELIDSKKYKKTDVGMIPIDWEVKTMWEVGENITGLTYSPDNVKDYGVLVLRSSNVQNGKLAFENNVYVQMDLPSRVIVKENDILICVRNGSKHLIGKCALIDKKTEGSAFGAFMSIYRSQFSNYIFHQFQSDNIQKQINEVLGATINQITNKDFASFRIPLPPTLAEQTLIATALSDADALISSLELLINKKKLIKQGTMQQLLKPKKGWEIKKLGDLVKITSGDSPSKYTFQSYGIPYFKVEQLNNSNKYQIHTPYYVETGNAIPQGSIIFPKRGASILLNKVRILKQDSLMDTNLMTLTLSEELHSEFIYYLLTHIELWRIADTTSIPQINNKHINPIEISIPSIQDQIQIATVLSDMDDEIAASENKLDKYKKIKQGMMQNLLTGKIRLV